MSERLEIHAIMVKKSFCHTRGKAMEIVAGLARRIYRYEPGAQYHHFIIKPAKEFKRIRTWTPRKLKAVKIKYGPLKEEK